MQYISMRSSLIKKLLGGSVIFYGLSGVASLLNYVFYPIIGRMVSTGQYGEIQFLISMFNQLAVGFVVLNILAIIVSAELANEKKRSAAIRSLNKTALIASSIIVALGILLVYSNQGNLSLHSPLAIIFLGLALLMNVPLTIQIGILQGRGKFISSGVLGMTAAFGKLAASVLLVAFGLGVNGAILGIAIGITASTIIGYLMNMKKDDKPANTGETSGIKQLSFIRNRAVVAIIAVTLITILSVADTIVSRIFLGHEQAGQYASIATATKMILAATSPIIWLALPASLSGNKRLISRYLLITVLVSLFIGVLLSSLPSLITTALTGISAGQFLVYVPLASLSMTLCASAFLIISISIGLDKLKPLIWSMLIALAAFAIIFISIARSDPILASLIAQSAACAILIAGSIRHCLAPDSIAHIPS